MIVRIAALVLAALSFGAIAQAPAAPPPVPPDVSPLYIATYLELSPSARCEGAALVKASRDASRAAPGNLRAVAVQRMRRPGQFVVLSAWQNKAAWDAAGEGMKAHREKLQALRNAPADDRFHSALTVGPMDIPAAAGGVYGVSPGDVIPPQKDKPILSLETLGEAKRTPPGKVPYAV